MTRVYCCASKIPFNERLRKLPFLQRNDEFLTQIRSHVLPNKDFTFNLLTYIPWQLHLSTAFFPEDVPIVKQNGNGLALSSNPLDKMALKPHLSSIFNTRGSGNVWQRESQLDVWIFPPPSYIPHHKQHHALKSAPTAA